MVVMKRAPLALIVGLAGLSLLVLAVIAGAAFSASGVSSASGTFGTTGLPDAPPAPSEEINPDADADSAKIVLAGGCFWCTEYIFEHVDGVTDVVSGYAGGSEGDADYKKVSMGETDHAEVIEVTYDPSKVTLGDLFRVFFGPAHDPTQLNRQGPDYGKQYRSAVFYATDAQKAAAEAYMKQLTDASVFDKKIETTLEPLTGFYAAEDYHQNYVNLHPDERYVVVNALPKVEKLKKQLPELYTEERADASA